MKTPNIVKLALPATLISMLLGGVACNEKSDPNNGLTYGDMSNVSITQFKLKSDFNVLNGLDSIFFSIDLDNGVVFNADSLPKGTPITDLIPVISYPNTVDSAFIIMENGQKRSGTIDYKKNPTDTVDFTGKVSLRLVARDGKTSRTYRLKVNVHNLVSDSLTWSDMATAKLPSRYANPMAQKSVGHDSGIYTMIREHDGSLTLASTADPAEGAWTKTAVAEPARFNVSTFTSTEDTFYVLADNGELMKSADALAWTSTGEVWNAMLGAFNKSVLGIAVRGGVPAHVSYPANYAETPLEPGFPVREYSNMGVFVNKWSVDPVGIIAGGLDIDGKDVNAVWAYDGMNWAKISEGKAGSLRQGTLIPYYSYRSVDNNGGLLEFNVWLMFGGVDSAGELNRTLYLSYDNGVNWQKAVDYMQLPDFIPGLRAADGIVLMADNSLDLKDYWTKMPARRVAPWYVKSELDGYTLSWQCPYIYILGGVGADSKLNTTVWRGVLNRLTFAPLI